MNLGGLRDRLARLTRATAPAQSQLPIVDPITTYLRSMVARGETPTPTTPAAVEAAKVTMQGWFARAATLLRSDVT